MSVVSRPKVRALRMMGSRYRLNRGLPLFPVNQSTAVMKTTMDQDSIDSRARVRPGKNWRARNATLAAANKRSSPDTGQGSWIRAPDHTSTSAASARQRISMERVLRTRRLVERGGGHRAMSAHRRNLELLHGPLDLGIPLEQGRIGRRRRGGGLRVALG